MMRSSDIGGPVVRPRIEKLYTWVDPLQYRDNFRYEFEHEILDAVETESIYEVFLGKQRLKVSGTYNDYYGFGRSRKSAVEDAQALFASQESPGLDIVVTTTVISTAVFFDDKKPPFYKGTVRCFEVPGSWHRIEEGQPLNSRLSFVTWRNGQPGPDAESFDALIADIFAQDAAGNRRDGPLR